MSNRIKTHFHRPPFFWCAFKSGCRKSAYADYIFLDFNLKIQFFIGNVITSPGKTEFSNPQLKKYLFVTYVTGIQFRAINHLLNVDEYLTQVFFPFFCQYAIAYRFIVVFLLLFAGAWHGIFLPFLLGHIS